MLEVFYHKYKMAMSRHFYYIYLHIIYTFGLDCCGCCCRPWLLC